ncbi:capsule biosynthesis protein [Paracoccus ravus]|uniref:capsule biosynthesis protein n=1 Tax=Paracoccus ravus TaxID=2447760 RepID=UPI001FD6C71F|nr:capsule biosynthesis protein [Paracoccus ravus]
MSNPNDTTNATGRKPLPEAQSAGIAPEGAPREAPQQSATARSVARPFPAKAPIQNVSELARASVRPLPSSPASETRSAPQPIPVKPVPASVPAKPVPARTPAMPPAGPAQTPPIRPTVATSYARRRHWFLLLTFLLLVVLPGAFWGWYLWTRAQDQYVSTVGFSVHKEELSPAVDLLGGLAPLTGAAGASDTDVLYEYIRSQDMVERIDAELDLRSRFSRDWPQDFIFAFDPKGHVEDLTDYWQWQVKVLYDTSSNLITLNVHAFSPEDAQRIAAAAFQASSDKINALSAIARDDATRLAKTELEAARDAVTQSRQAMTQFRMRTMIVDPEADLTSQMGVLTGLQTQLAEALVAHDVLTETAKPDDHRVIKSQQRIDALRNLIETERGKFGQQGKGPDGESYSQLVAEYEKLMVDREFAEGTYRTARVAYETALAEARRKSRYLAAHIEPKVAQSSVVPNRPWLLVVGLGLLLSVWSILALIYYSIRDRV